MEFDVVSIIYIAIFVLFVIIGLIKGFFKTIISFMKDLMTFVLSILLCKPISNLIYNSGLGDKMNSGLYDYFYNKGGIFSLNITAENKDLVIEQTLQESNLPDSLNSLLTSIVDKFLVNHPDGLVISEALSHTITTYACYAIAFIALFIVIRVLAIFLTKLFSFVEKLPVIGFLNKVFGMVLNGIVGILLICLISYGLTLIIPMDLSISNTLVEVMQLDNPEVTSISKFFYENNFLLAIIAFFQELFV